MCVETVAWDTRCEPEWNTIERVREGGSGGTEGVEGVDGVRGVGTQCQGA